MLKFNLTCPPPQLSARAAAAAAARAAKKAASIDAAASKQSEGAELAARTLAAAHRALDSLRAVLRSYHRALAPPVAAAAVASRQAAVALGQGTDACFQGDAAPFVQLYFGGRLAIVGLDLWGSNSGAALWTPPLVAGKRVSNALSKRLGLKKEAEEEEPPEEEKGKGVLGEEQWGALLDLLAGQHPHGDWG
jgi:hypothetical protein